MHGCMGHGLRLTSNATGRALYNRLITCGVLAETSGVSWQLGVSLASCYVDVISKTKKS